MKGHANKRFQAQLPTMSELTSVYNPILGKSSLELRHEQFDLYQEISNTGFGDMLHDWERNAKYYAAIRKTIAQMHDAGRHVHVLDIGTGTGLLAMMAAQAGADMITACEAFMPMADCAERIIAANGFGQKIRLIKKRSTELTVGAACDMAQLANLLVAELLDTELIGEGAIAIYRHAHAKLLTADVICIPAHGTCYAQVVDSTLAAQWNTLKVLTNLDGDVLLRTPENIINCKGTAALHDVQLSQMPQHTFRALTSPFRIFEFDFMAKTPLETKRTNNIQLKAQTAGCANMVFFWWSIKLDVAGDVELNCAPYWAHPDFKQLAGKCDKTKPLQNVIPWRDHWMQAIYYMPKPLHLHAIDSEFQLSCNHDEFSFWFDVFKEQRVGGQCVERQFCTCLLHQTYSRTRIGQMNYAKRNKSYMRYLEQTIDQHAHVLVLGDGCTLGLATAKLGAAAVICVETQLLSRRFMQSLVQFNELQQVRIVDSLAAIDEATLAKISHVFAEPHFQQSIYPWDNLYYGTLIAELKQKLRSDVQFAPQSAHVVCLPVEFVDLQKFNQPIDICEGFDLTLFDAMVQKAKEISHSNIEVFSLWEYPCRALAQPQTMLQLSLDDYGPALASSGEIAFECDGICNGVAIWMTWHLNADARNNVCTGPELPVQPGEYVTWNMFQQQGVYLMGAGTAVAKDRQQKLKWHIDSMPQKGLIQYNFELIN